MTSSTAVQRQAPAPSMSSSAPSPRKKTCTNRVSPPPPHHDDILRSAVLLDRQDSPANHSTVSATNVIDMVDEAMAEITTVVYIDQRNEDDEFQEDILVPLKGCGDEDDDEAASLPRPTKRRRDNKKGKNNLLRRKTRGIAATVPTTTSPTRTMYKQELLMDDMTGLELAFRSMMRANALANTHANSSSRTRRATQTVAAPVDQADQDEDLALIEDDILSVGDVEEDFDDFAEDGLPRYNNTSGGFTSSQVRDLVQLHGLRRTSV